MHYFNSPKIYEVGAIITPILLMKKLKSREVSKMGSGVIKNRAGISLMSKAVVQPQRYPASHSFVYSFRIQQTPIGGLLFAKHFSCWGQSCDYKQIKSRLRRNLHCGWDISGIDVSSTKEKIWNGNSSQDTEIKKRINISVHIRTSGIILTDEFIQALSLYWHWPKFSL